MRCWAFSTAWKARLSRAIQRVRLALSRSRLAWSLWSRRCCSGLDVLGEAGRMMRRRGAVMSGALKDLEPDAAVLERLLADLVALLAGLEPGLLHRIQLQEAVELGLLAPAAAEVVVAHFPGGQVDDHGVLPAGQLHEQAGGLAAVEPGGALDRGGQAETLAGRDNSDGVADLGLDADDVRHADGSSCELGVGERVNCRR